MKKMLSNFDLFECTDTPLGKMMRVMNGWVVGGAFIPESDEFGAREVEVYEKVEDDVFLDLHINIDEALELLQRMTSRKTAIDQHFSDDD